MTTVDYDDSIEIISYRAETDSNAEREFVSFSSFRTDRRGRKPNHPGKARPNRAASITCNLTTPQAPVTGRARDLRPCPGVHHSGNDPFMSPQYKRMKCAIIVMAVVMLTACVVLVGVSLSMADHIDELVVLLHSSTCRSDDEPPAESTDNAEDTAAQTNDIPSPDLAIPSAERAAGPQAEQEVPAESLLPTQATETDPGDDILKKDEKQEKKGDGEWDTKKEEEINKDDSEVNNGEAVENKENSNVTTNTESKNGDNADDNNKSSESEESSEKDKQIKEEPAENSEETVTEKTAIVEDEVTLQSAYVQPLGSADSDAEVTTEENIAEEETTVAEVEEEKLHSAQVPLQGVVAGEQNIEATTEENVEVTQEENVSTDKEGSSDNAGLEIAGDQVTEVAQVEPEITTVAEPESDLESGKTGEAGDDGVVSNDVTEQMNILETEEPQVEEPTTSGPDGAIDPAVEPVETVTVSEEIEQSTEMTASKGELHVVAGDIEHTAENTEDAATTEIPEVEVTTEEMESPTTASIVDGAIVGLGDENKEEIVTTVEDISSEITTESIAEEKTENVEITTETLTETVTETIPEKEAEIETSTELALTENEVTRESSDITLPILADVVDHSDIVTGEPVQSHPDTTTIENKDIKEEKTEQVLADHDVTTVESEVIKEEKKEIEKPQETPKAEVQPKTSGISATVKFGQKLTPEQMREFKKELRKKMNAERKKNLNKKQVKESLRRRRDADDDTLEDDDEPYTDDNLILEQDENGNVFVRTTDGAPVIEDLAQLILDNKDDLQQAAGVPILDAQPGQAASSTNAEDPPVASVWDIHYGLFITIIVLGAISLLIIVIYCIRCSRRRGSYDKTPMAVEDGHFQARHPVVMTSPFTDEEMVKGETLTKSTTPNLYSAPPGANGSSKNGHHPSMKEKVDPSITSNGGGQHLSKMEEEYEFGVVPWDQLSGSERNLPDVEYTRF